MEFETGPEALLQHQDFVRGLAASLLADPGAADDVAQEAWLAAIESPPTQSGNVRGWLATVVRNAARMHWRGESRRRAREGAVATPEATISTAEVVEREMLRRDVVDAVLALDEPYRSAVLWRFYRDTPPREIATLRGIPVETVKSHIKRGLARLRDALASRHGGDAAKLGAVLAVVAGLSTDAVAGVTGATVGGAAMAGSKKLFGAAAVLALVAIPVGLHLGGVFDGAAGGAGVAPLTPLEGEAAGAGEAVDRTATADSAGAAPLPPVAAPPAKASPATLIVTVEGIDGRPAAGAGVHIAPRSDLEAAPPAPRRDDRNLNWGPLCVTGPLPNRSEFSQYPGGTTDASGQLRLSAAEAAPGTDVVAFVTRGPDVGRSAVVRVGEPSDEPGRITVRLEDGRRPSDGRGAVAGRAYLDGSLLRNAELTCNRMWQQDRRPDGSTTGSGGLVGLATDGEGRWGWRNLTPGTYTGEFDLAGAGRLKTTFRIDAGGVTTTDLHFAAPAIIEGRLDLPAGTIPERVNLRAYGADGAKRDGEFVLAGGNPRYRISSVSPGPWTLRLAVLGAGLVEARCEIRRGGITGGPVLRLEAGATVRGRFIDDAGVPVVGQSICVVRDPDKWFLLGEGVTDRDGRFAIPGLPAGAYELVWYARKPNGWRGRDNLWPITVPAEGLDLGTREVSLWREHLCDGALRVRVLRGGAAVAGASIRIIAGEQREAVTANARGIAEVAKLSRGSTRVVATDASGGIGSVVVEVIGLRTTDVTVELAPASALYGRIDPAVAPSPKLYLWRMIGKQRKNALDGRKTVPMDADGNWRVEGLAPGRFQIWAVTSGAAGRLHFPVTVGAGVEQEVRLPFTEFPGTLRVEVPARAKELSGGVNWIRDEGMRGSRPLKQWRDGGTEIGGLPTGPVNLLASWVINGAAWQVSRTVELSGDRPHTVQLPWAADAARGALSGRCEVAAADEARTKSLVGFAVAMRDGAVVTVRLNGDGRTFDFPALAAGSWKVSCYFGDDHRSARKRATDAEVTAGVTTDVTVPAVLPK